MMRPPAPLKQRGFTLTELAVVMVIVGLLVGGVVGSYSTMINVSKFKDAQTQLNTVSDALLGYASANGRLPCPAVDGVHYGPVGTGNSYGAESVVGGASTGGQCTVAASSMPGLGYVPAATLGLTPVDTQGFLIDAWNNRVLYAVSSNGANYDFTTQGNLRTALTDALASTPSPNLRICSTTTLMTNAGSTTAACASAAVTLTNTAAAVIISTGPNGATGGSGADEAQNLHAPGLTSANWPFTTKDRLYISHTQTPAGATNGEFDDMVLWISPALVYSRIMNGGI
jgi:prepilin-type N-terminal cleavage/methylation domain-containing protein